jgi:hypothetical protein
MALGVWDWLFLGEIFFSLSGESFCFGVFTVFFKVVF